MRGFCVCLWFGMHYFVSFLVLQSYWRGRESWLLCIYFLRMSCNSKCFVAIPQGAVGWSALYDCGISWSYSLTFLYLTEPNISEGPDYEKYQQRIELQGEVQAHVWRGAMIFFGGQHFEFWYCLFCFFTEKWTFCGYEVFCGYFLGVTSKLDYRILGVILKLMYRVGLFFGVC